MKTLVTYFSQTGKTKQVAEAIFETIEGEREIRELSEVESTDGYDLLFVGFPIQAFAPAAQAKDFLANHCRNKQLALFMTHAMPEDFEEIEEWIKNCKNAAVDTDVVGAFNCQGEMADFILDAMLKNDDPQMQKLAKGASTSKGQPDAARIERARAFAADIMSRYV